MGHYRIARPAGMGNDGTGFVYLTVAAVLAAVLLSAVNAAALEENHGSRVKRSEPVEAFHQDSSRYMKRPQRFSFGLGKRGMPLEEEDDVDDEVEMFNDLDLEDGLEAVKRDPYAFGLGKRSGYGKREPYAFGLGKRTPYQFGLGKREPYAFGLGKRSYYGFGLGKREPYAFGLGRR